MRTNKLAQGSLLTALGVVLLLFSSLIPLGRAGMAALAGVVTAVAAAKLGASAAALTWAATSVLALLIAPVKTAALLFAAFFGPYALVKNLIERHMHGRMQWLPKLAFCTAVSAALLHFSAQIMAMVPEVLSGMIPLAVLGIDVIFVVYDVVFSKVISYFIVRIS